MIVHLALTGGDAGSEDERARLMALQDEIAAAIDAADVGQFDGDEWGGGECVLYMYGPDADRLFGVVRPVISRLPARAGSFAIKRWGDAGDPRVKEEKVSLG